MAPRDIKIQNTLSGKKEAFLPLTPGRANVYMCGPTVYGYTHVGNARTALMGDLIVRILRYGGYDVHFARNVTDVDDKIIKVANETGQTSNDVAAMFTKAYFDEIREMNAESVNVTPKATEHIDEMIRMSQKLVDDGIAYTSSTPFGTDVYYRVRKFDGYGKLSKRHIDDLLAGARVEPGESKEDPLDFALWKSAKPGEPSWTSPWGEGRPGWHIECSAMIDKNFPEGLDIHMGGMDLVFPHHENEIAQSEAFSGKTLARYWIHGGMLTFAREKMSKSLGNIVTTRKFIDTYGAETLRLMVMQNHYRGPLDFTEEVILRSEALLERLYLGKKAALESSGATGDVPDELKNLKTLVDDALFDDFGSPKAMGLVLKGLRACHKTHSPAAWKAWAEVLPVLEKALGLLTKDATTELAAIRARRLDRMGVTAEFVAGIDQRLKDRDAVRARKDFAESDRIRKELEAEGIMVMDSPDGTAWSVARKS